MEFYETGNYRQHKSIDRDRVIYQMVERSNFNITIGDASNSLVEAAESARKKSAQSAESASQRVGNAAALALQQVAMETTLAIQTVEEAAEVPRMSYDELSLRLNERTSQLEIALRESEAFSYSVSHDLRSPLRAINGYLSILKEDFGDFLPAEAKSSLDRTLTASSNMGKLIDDLLDLAKAIRCEPAKEMVDLSKLVALIVAQSHEVEPARDVTITVAKGITVRGDSGLLNQVFVNLLGNAWKYSFLEKKLCLEFGEKAVGGERVFFVKDNGIGFDMKYHDKIYGVFERLHRKEYEGNGIGLAIVKRIIERHGGKLWADAEPDRGACFNFTLSADRVSAAGQL